jgi:hypothetical protein
MITVVEAAPVVEVLAGSDHVNGLWLIARSYARRVLSSVPHATLKVRRVNAVPSQVDLFFACVAPLVLVRGSATCSRQRHGNKRRRTVLVAKLVTCCVAVR